MERLKLATVWLGGCSGCHMSFLDLDEWLIELAGRTRFEDVAPIPAVAVSTAVPAVPDRGFAESARLLATATT